MQTSGGNDAMAWNRYYNDWQDGWKDGWKNPAWYEQPADGACMPNYDAYGSWQPGNNGNQMYANCGSGLGQAPTGGSGAGGYSGNQNRASARVNSLSFDALRGFQGSSGEDDDVRLPSSMTGERQLDQESTSASGMGTTARNDSSDDDEPAAPKEASQEEKDEAERIVRTAFREAKERDRLREKVGKASAADLQAMLNARLNKVSSK